MSQQAASVSQSKVSPIGAVGPPKTDTYAQKAKIKSGDDYFVSFIEKKDSERKNVSYTKDPNDNNIIVIPSVFDETDEIGGLLFQTMPLMADRILKFLELHKGKSPTEIIVDHFRPLSIRFNDNSEEHLDETAADIFPFIKALQIVPISFLKIYTFFRLKLDYIKFE